MAVAVFKVGNCVSCLGYKPFNAPAKKKGIFVFPEVASRLALATPTAFRALNKAPVLLEEMSQNLAVGELDGALLLLHGFKMIKFQAKPELKLFGIRLEDLSSPERREKEKQRFAAAARRVEQYDDPAGRRLFLGLMGVKAFGIEALTADEYTGMLGRVQYAYSNPSFTGVSEIGFSRTASMDVLEIAADGGTRINFAQGQLAGELFQGYPRLRLDD